MNKIKKKAFHAKKINVNTLSKKRKDAAFFFKKKNIYTIQGKDNKFQIFFYYFLQIEENEINFAFSF